MASSFRRAGISVIAVAIAIGSVGVISPAVATDNIVVYLNHDRLVKLPLKVATIVIGNPLMADVSLLKNDLIVLTGKSAGTTNIIALDRWGAVLLDKTMRVQRADDDDDIVVFRGDERGD